jgi:hypothetical protein
MVEDDETGGEDNDDDDGDAFGLESAARRESKKSTQGSEVSFTLAYTTHGANNPSRPTRNSLRITNHKLQN